MTMTQDELKEQVAQAAVDFIFPKLSQEMILGIGTGSTVDVFIDLLAKHRTRFAGAVSSSERSTARLLEHGITVYDLNAVDVLEWYIDGADEITAERAMTKGGGGALTREKLVESVARRLLFMVVESNLAEE